jgi:hypothetical protein
MADNKAITIVIIPYVLINDFIMRQI